MPTSTATATAPTPTPTSTATSLTIREPPFTYLHLSSFPLSPSPSAPSSTAPPPLDALTTHRYLNSAFRQFLGITGTAIPIDILKVEARDVWIRVPREDGSAVVAALGSWVGEGVSWRVRARGDWLAAVVGREGMGRVWPT